MVGEDLVLSLAAAALPVVRTEAVGGVCLLAKVGHQHAVGHAAVTTAEEAPHLQGGALRTGRGTGHQASVIV